MTYVGLDGYRNGWVAIWLSESRAELCFLAKAEEIFKRPFARAMIDIPIGLPEYGYRRCDEIARELLGSNRSRVFLGARRSILDCAPHSEASALLKHAGEKGVSRQLFCLGPKLREIDALMKAPDRQKILM